MVIFASVYEPDRQKSLQVGGDAFLPKPVEAERLLEQLQPYLQLKWEHAPVAAPDEVLETLPMIFPSADETPLPGPPREEGQGEKK